MFGYELRASGRNVIEFANRVLQSIIGKLRSPTAVQPLLPANSSPSTSNCRLQHPKGPMKNEEIK